MEQFGQIYNYKITNNKKVYLSLLFLYHIKIKFLIECLKKNMRKLKESSNKKVIHTNFE